ncbi:Hypothetical protein A7982_05911 [Minicystis rosea]|nr:Hypothetical protein A7982_05911 [Minicystis rosea]
MSCSAGRAGSGALVRRPPPIVLKGWQRIPGATVDVVARGDRLFFRLRGCDAPERVTLPSVGE